MKYKVMKVLNNNAVLACNKEHYQVVLMSKGIGYNSKKGQLVNESGDNQKVFYILNSNHNINKLKQFSCDEEKIKQMTKEIIDIAKDKLNIQNDNLYDTLLDHITFAIECIELNLPIDNPFINEISILYSREYDVAKEAAKIIKENIGIEIGEDETGFIALHLHSACQNNRIQTTMKNTRLYSEILSLLSKYIKESSKNNLFQSKVFLLSMYQIVQYKEQGKELYMPFKNQVKLSIPESYRFSVEIAQLIEKEINVSLDENSIAFLALEVYKFLNM